MSQPNSSPNVLYHRRGALRRAAIGLAALPGLTSMCARARAGGATAPSEAAVRDRTVEFLKSLLLTPRDVEDWLQGKAFPFARYDPLLGYLHIDRDFSEGLDGAVCRYRYDALGARRMLAHADEPCRINTYGNSFTSCEQVSDGETWQEALAAHIGEPVRNYGIGGYSVYQAYLRMQREESRAPAETIVFNVFDDDHYRNLHGWQRFKFGVNRKSTNPTVPHVSVERDQLVERPNPCPDAATVLKLCDLDWVYDRFKDDSLLRNRVERQIRRDAGQPVPDFDYDDVELTRNAIEATQRILDLVQAFASAKSKKLLYVLSYGPYIVRQYLEHGKRFDLALLEFLQQRGWPCVDLLAAHGEDYAQFKVSPEAYTKRYFIGHYSPRGNQFCAFALKNRLVEMLAPKPPAYRP